MRRIFLALVAMSGAASACSSSQSNKAANEPLTDGGVSVVPVFDSGGTVARDTGTPDATPTVDGGDLGALAIVDLADVPCQAPGGEASEVTPADPNGPLYDRMGAVGGRRFAVSSDGLSFLTFGSPSGSSTPVPNVITAAGEGTRVAALVKSGPALSLQRFDGDGNPSGAAVALATRNDWQTLSSGSTKTFVAWSDGALITGRLLDIGGTVATTVDLGADGAGVRSFAMSAVPSGSGFILAWTRNLANGTLETVARRVEADGTAGAPQSLVLSASGKDHLLTGLAPLAGGGAAMLIDEGAPSKATVLVRLDPQGAVTGPGVRLLGSVRGLGVATNNGELGIVATKDNRSAFRALAGNGSAIGPWYCLDDNSDGGATFYPITAIDAQGAGYALLTRVSNGAATYRLVDHLGAGL